MKAILGCLLFLSLTSFSGCDRSANDTVQPVDKDSLVGLWTLSGPKTNFTITLNVAFKSAEGSANQYQLTGSSPVNEYGAVATVQSNGSVNISSIISTKRGSSTDAMAAEINYYNSLQKVTKAELVGGKLQLRSDDANWPTLLYNKQ